MEKEQYSDGEFNDEITNLAVVQENEACAKVAESRFECKCKNCKTTSGHFTGCWAYQGDLIAKAIRARVEK